jgi:hypothetical protein
VGHPNPDPGEEFPHVNTQLFNHVEPAGNEHLWVEHMEAPHNTPPKGTQAENSGFVHDYFISYRRLMNGKAPSTEQMRHIMGSFAPGMLPVLSTLAREFAVFDHWFCALPSQTFCNRSFFHASTSHWFVTNKHGGGCAKWTDGPAAPTVFDRLDEAGMNWKIYFDELQLVAFTGVLHAPTLQNHWQTGHFATMEQFYIDTENGQLPAYSFIEPRMAYNHNDFHPPLRQGSRKRSGGSRCSRQCRIGCARRRSTHPRDLHGGQGVTLPTRLERDQHHAADHLRRARWHLRPRGTACRDPTAPGCRAGRDRIRLRAAGLPGTSSNLAIPTTGPPPCPSGCHRIPKRIRHTPLTFTRTSR